MGAASRPALDGLLGQVEGAGDLAVGAAAVQLGEHVAFARRVAGTALLDRCYRAALDHGYLWHEFGDVNLLLP